MDTATMQSASNNYSEVRKEFAVRSDGGYAHRLQTEEFSKHYEHNRTSRQAVRQGFGLARLLQDQELQAEQLRRFRDVQDARVLAEEDEFLAEHLSKKWAEEDSHCDKEPSNATVEQEVEDARLAARLQRQEEKRIRRAHYQRKERDLIKQRRELEEHLRQLDRQLRSAQRQRQSLSNSASAAVAVSTTDPREMERRDFELARVLQEEEEEEVRGGESRIRQEIEAADARLATVIALIQDLRLKRRGQHSVQHDAEVQTTPPSGSPTNSSATPDSSTRHTPENSLVHPSLGKASGDSDLRQRPPSPIYDNPTTFSSHPPVRYARDSLRQAVTHSTDIGADLALRNSQNPKQATTTPAEEKTSGRFQKPTAVSSNRNLVTEVSHSPSTSHAIHRPHHPLSNVVSQTVSVSNPVPTSRDPQRVSATGRRILGQAQESSNSSQSRGLEASQGKSRPVDALAVSSRLQRQPSPPAAVSRREVSNKLNPRPKSAFYSFDAVPVAPDTNYRAKVRQPGPVAVENSTLFRPALPSSSPNNTTTPLGVTVNIAAAIDPTWPQNLSPDVPGEEEAGFHLRRPAVPPGHYIAPGLSESWASPVPGERRDGRGMSRHQRSNSSGQCKQQ